MKNFCRSLREHARKITKFEEKEMIPLTNKEQESYESAKSDYISKTNFEDKYTNTKKIL